VPGALTEKTRWRRWRRLSALAAAVGLIGLAYGYYVLKARQGREREARAAVAGAQADLMRGQPDRALQAIARVPESGPWEADLLTVKGLAFAALDRPDAVRPILERSLKLNPNQPIAAKVLAAVYFTGEEADLGFALLEQAARLDPDDFRPWYAAGDILLRLQNLPEDAAKAFRESLRRKPDHEESRVGLIDALLALGSNPEVGPLLEAALRDRPDDARVLRLAARNARLSGHAEEMDRYIEQSLALDPDDPECLVLRAQSHQLKGRLPEALVDSERAVALAPNNPAALSLLARVEAASGLKDRSAATSARHQEVSRRADRINALRDELRKRPDDPEPRWKMGQAAAEGGMTTLAIYSFRVALALDPKCAPAREGLAALHASAALPSSAGSSPAASR
jgi:tetratricopeptide (TPR) repeat protein